MHKIIFIITLVFISNGCYVNRSTIKISKDEINKIVNFDDFFYNETNKTFSKGMHSGAFYLDASFSKFNFNKADSTINIQGFVFLPGNARAQDVNVILGKDIFTFVDCKTVATTNKNGEFEIKVKFNEISKLYFAIMYEPYVGLCYNIGSLYNLHREP
ncbi:MAG: hypothetical protein WCK02_14950 [Bacteroidota bacterium]